MVDQIYKNLYLLDMEAVEFLGASLDDLRQFPLAARRAMGYQIDRVQNGHDAEDWKPMPRVWPI